MFSYGGRRSISQRSGSRLTTLESCETKPELENKNVDYKKELTSHFFNEMLAEIVDSWESSSHTSEESICSGYKVIQSHQYQPASNFEETEKTVSELESPSEMKIEKTMEDEKAEYSTRLKRKSSKKAFSSRMKLKRYLDRSRKYDKKIRTTCINSRKIEKPWIVPDVEEIVRIKFKNGNIYEGAMFKKKLDGKGKFIWADGTIYIGEFKNGKIAGKGKMYYPDETLYEGEFFENLRHGNGAMYPSDSECIYKGEWNYGAKHGTGWQQFEQGNWYEGMWNENVREGYGIRQYPSGARYQGGYKMGMRHGRGSAIMKNNDFYNGEWIQGMKYGYGEYTWKAYMNRTFTVPVQSKYNGFWEDDVMHGIGLINFGMNGGARYAGCFSHNEKHGPGVLICENGVAIDSNPLFINDKPVHITDSGSINKNEQESSKSERSSSVDMSQVDKVKKEDTETLLVFAEKILENKMQEIYGSSSGSITREKEYCSFKLKADNEFPSMIADKSILANINYCEIIFPQITDSYSSLAIPIHTSSELIDLNNVIVRFMDKVPIVSTRSDDIGSINEEKDYIIFENYKRNASKHSLILHSPFHVNSKSMINSCATTHGTYEMRTFEEKLLRQAIRKYLPELRHIYHQYAMIGAYHEQIKFKPWLMRICLWQLLRDCKITTRMSLIEVDEILNEESIFTNDNLHNPFEVIYFWQYLKTLLYIAWEFYWKEFIDIKGDGVLCSIFTKLMEEDIIPHFGRHTGGALFDYRDLLPYKGLYDWYLTIGEPITVVQLLRTICKFSNHPPQNIVSVEDNSVNAPYIVEGRNAMPIANMPSYITDDEPQIRTEEQKSKIRIFKHLFAEKLEFLRILGSKKILNIVNQICPAVKINKDIVNINYPLCFLEFYEILLLCTQEKVNLDNKYMEEESSRLTSMWSIANVKQRKRTKLGKKVKNKVTLTQ